MKLSFLFPLFVSAIGCNHSAGSAKFKGQSDNFPLDSTKAIIRFRSDTFKVSLINRTDLEKRFNNFYEDRYGHFFIKSFGHQKTKEHEFQPVEVFVELPKLDSATYKDFGSYFKDSSKVMCVFENSDGGNYVWLKDADSKSFEAFKNSFGGKDKKYVFYKDIKLSGLNPSTVKVYSDTKNCTNCTPYFTDGKVCFFGDEKVENRNCIIPPEYKFIEF
jgi:hypothetical protein